MKVGWLLHCVVEGVLLVCYMEVASNKNNHEKVSSINLFEMANLSKMTSFSQSTFIFLHPKAYRSLCQNNNPQRLF